MNIHGYKKKHKVMTSMLKYEESKKEDRNEAKIERLEKAKLDCQKRIKTLRQEKEKK